MNYGELLRNNLIKRVNPNFNQISSQIKRAEKDLKTAESVSSIDLTWSFTIAYHAIIRAGRALMYSRGFLPTAKQTHKTIVDFAKMILGDEYTNLVIRFDRMRRQRHNFIYDSKNNITTGEANSALEIAKRLIERLITIIEKENPQKNLFD